MQLSDQHAKVSKTLLRGGKWLCGRELRDNEGLCFDSQWQPLSAHQDLFQTVWQIPQSWTIAPGFIDIHIHGMVGKDVMDGSVESLTAISEALVRNGVTSWLGTTMTMEISKIQQALMAARDFKTPCGGAKLEGIHLEGPYISPKMKGAQDETHILRPDFKQFERDFYDIAPKLIKHLTCAPEMEGAIEFIENLTQRGIVTAMGHTGCSFDQAMEAKLAGASHITHFFNAMPQTHHREPGLVGAGLMTDLSVEWIADGVHCREEWFAFLLNLKKEKSVLVTDAMCAAGLCQGHYHLGGQEVVVDERSARLTNGVLAGSILTMDQAVKNMIRNCPDQAAEVLYAASTAPAKVIGLEKTGRIELGNFADAVLLSDNYEIKAVWVNGSLSYIEEEAKAFIQTSAFASEQEAGGTL